MFKTHNDKNIDTNGICLVGDLHVKYDVLFALFGKHHKGDGFKLDACWDIEFSDGLVCSIYNWKDGKNYLGMEGLDVCDMKDWKIASHSREASVRIKEMVRQFVEGYQEIQMSFTGNEWLVIRNAVQDFDAEPWEMGAKHAILHKLKIES